MRVHVYLSIGRRANYFLLCLPGIYMGLHAEKGPAPLSFPPSQIGGNKMVPVLCSSVSRSFRSFLINCSFFNESPGPLTTPPQKARFRFTQKPLMPFSVNCSFRIGETRFSAHVSFINYSHCLYFIASSSFSVLSNKFLIQIFLGRILLKIVPRHRQIVWKIRLGPR